MERIKILSTEDLNKSLVEFGLRKSVEPTKVLEVNPKLIDLSTLKVDNSMCSLKLHGFTVKFEASLLSAVQKAQTFVEVSLFEAEIDKKPIKWARITAAE